MTLGSLFDGIGGFPFAGRIVGINPLWASEIEPYCVRVTERHFPDMAHLGDITKINGAEIKPVDIITFGSPCQNLSIAGNRTGLKGEQSGLFDDAIRIIYEMRRATNGKYPKYIVWENVPGAFSSNGGNDFRTVLEKITQTDIPMPKSGRWAKAGVVGGAGVCAAWRTLDAQRWGVAQRRKRIYLVGSFGDDSAIEILFKPDSVRRYLAPSRTERERITCGAENRTGTASGALSVENYANDSRVGIREDGTVQTLTQQMGTGGGNVPLVGERLTAHKAAVYSAGFIDRAPAGAGSIGYEEETSPTLRASVVSATIYSLDRAAYNQGKNAKYDISIRSDAAQTVVSKGPGSVAYAPHYIIRKYTPLECERLQGFPDDWTNLPGGSDTARYKAIGNSLAIPCALRVLGYIADYDKIKS